MKAGTHHLKLNLVEDICDMKYRFQTLYNEYKNYATTSVDAIVKWRQAQDIVKVESCHREQCEKFITCFAPRAPRANFLCCVKYADQYDGYCFDNFKREICVFHFSHCCLYFSGRHSNYLLDMLDHNNTFLSTFYQSN